jgi:hypothetical protein
VLRQAFAEGDARIVAGEAELDAQERTFAGDRRPQLVERHARAAHVLRGDVAFVDDGDAIEAEHANRGAK